MEGKPVACATQEPNTERAFRVVCTGCRKVICSIACTGRWWKPETGKIECIFHMMKVIGAECTHTHRAKIAWIWQATTKLCHRIGLTSEKS